MTTSRNDIFIEALEKELKTLKAAAAEAKRLLDEYCSVGSELLNIHRELSVALKDPNDPERVAKIDDLSERQKRARKIIKMDFLTMIDKQIEADLKVSVIEIEIESRKASTRNLMVD